MTLSSFLAEDTLLVAVLLTKAGLEFTVRLQVRLAQLSTSAKQWSSQTQAQLRTVAAGHFGTPGEAPSSALHEIAAARGSGAAAGAAAAAASSSSREPDASAAPEGELDADQELEAYLRVRALSLPLLFIVIRRL